MEPTIKCGKQLAEHENLSESRFHDVNLTQADFDNVCLAQTRIHNVNMSDMTIECVQMGGTSFRHVGLPPEQRTAAKQRPLMFEDCDLNGSAFKKVDLSGAKIAECNIEGMTIDDMLVTDLIMAYKNRSK